MMVPSGKPVDEVIAAMLPSLQKGDVVIDGGNSNYNESMRRARELEEKGIDYLDVGTSGGLAGARIGACLTIGGKKEVYEKAEPVFKAISTKNGYLYVGSSGAGHFVKMVHNAIEYGMLEAYGEGFEMLKSSDFDLDLPAIAGVWGNGSVVRSWMLELGQVMLEKDAEMQGVSGEIGGGETGTWAVEYAKKKKVEVPAIETSLKMRGMKGHVDRFAGKVVGAIRNAFGGHELRKK